MATGAAYSGDSPQEILAMAFLAGSDIKRGRRCVTGGQPSSRMLLRVRVERRLRIGRTGTTTDDHRQPEEQQAYHSHSDRYL
jgi:hypothetical protein